MKEPEWQKVVTDLAEVLGWGWIHSRPAETSRGWRTAVEGTLAKGFPDLVLCRPPRLLFVELKTEVGKVSADQAHWLDLLSRCNGVEAYIWRPSDFDRLPGILS